MIKVYLSPSDQNRNVYAWGNTTEMEQCGLIADACEAALKRSGIGVINNQRDTMEERVAESNRWGADLHVCIHTNAFDGKVAGTRCFASSLTGEGYKAALRIFNELAPITPGTSENIKPYPGLYEIRMTTAPCAYLECEFHDVPRVAEWIVGHTEEIGEAIARGICNYFHVELEGAGDETETEGNDMAELDNITSCAETGDKPSDWAKDATEYCKRKGIFNGDGAGNYGWKVPITREAVAQVVYNAFERAGILDNIPDA